MLSDGDYKFLVCCIDCVQSLHDCSCWICSWTWWVYSCKCNFNGINTLCSKKRTHQNHGSSSIKSLPIFKFFTDRFSSKFAVKRLLKTTPHHKHVVTLLCEICLLHKLPCLRTEWSKLPHKIEPLKLIVEKNTHLVIYQFHGCLVQVQKK